MSAVNEVNMAKWIVALRSGKYRQTRGKLKARLGGGMCCLGVACDVSGLGTWEPDDLNADRKKYVIGAVWDDEALPRDVVSWLFGGRRPDLANPSIDIEDKESGSLDKTDCASANDDYKLRFPAIADALERTYLPGKKAEQILEAAP